MFICSL